MPFNARNRPKTDLLLCIAMLAGFAACGPSEPSGSSSPTRALVDTPRRDTVTVSFDYRGVIASVNTAEIRARVPGYLAEIAFEDSADVKRGELLFRIEPEPYEIALAEARAQRSDGQATLELAETRLERTRRAREANAVSEIELLEAKAARDAARAAVTSADAAIARAKLNLSYTSVRSPIDGRIGESLVDTGNLVGDGERTLLATVVQLDPIHAYFDSSEDISLRYLSRGDNGELETQDAPAALLELADETGFPHRGRVDYVGNELNAATGTLSIRAIFPNPNLKLFPGLFARIRVPFEEIEEALLVPQSAIGTDFAGSYLWVVDENGRVERRTVQLGDRYGGQRHVQSGIGADEQFVARGIQQIRPGSTVEPVPVESAAR